MLGRFADRTHLAAPQPAGPASTPAYDSDSIAREVAAVANLSAVPKLLEILCNVTGMRFAAVARVCGETAACAVKDDINFGLTPGAQLDLKSTLCFESRLER